MLLAKIPAVVIDRIHIEQLEVHGRVGVPDSERVEPQRLSLNVTLWPTIAELHDNIANTVNYSAVAECAKEFVNQHDYKLIETLAEKTAAHSAPVALREGLLYVRGLQPSLHYELECVAQTEILRKLKQRFGGKTICDVRFRLG